MNYHRGGFTTFDFAPEEDDLSRPFDLEAGEWEEGYQVTLAADPDFLLIDDNEYNNYDETMYYEDYMSMPLFEKSESFPQSHVQEDCQNVQAHRQDHGQAHHQGHRQLYVPTSNQRTAISRNGLSGKQRSSTVSHEARLSSQRHWERPMQSTHQQRQRLVTRADTSSLPQRGISRPLGVTCQPGTVRHPDMYRHVLTNQYHLASVYPSPPTSPSSVHVPLDQHRSLSAAAMGCSIDHYGEMEDIATRRRSRQF